MTRFLPSFGLALFLAVSAHAAESPKAEEAAAESTAAPETVSLEYGKKDAPVLIEEFASLSCSHCAHFHKDVLPVLDKKLLSPGKARLVSVSYIRNQPDLRGTMLLHCLKTNEERAQYAKVLFEMQDNWAFSDNPTASLIDIAKVGGLPEDTTKACLADKGLEESLVAGLKKITETHDIQGTPTIYINGKKYDGGPDADGIIKAVSALEPAKK